MFKKFIFLKRKAEDNIGRLIVFAITLIIAVSIVGLNIYFYKTHRENKIYLSTLGNVQSRLPELQSIGLCSGASFGIIKYNPINNIFILTCDSELGRDLTNIPGIIFFSGCKATDKVCIYSLPR